MRTVFDEGDREALLRRVSSLAPNSSRRWGTFTVGAMVCHLCQATRMALGELAVRPKDLRAFQVFPLKQLLLYALPFPRRAPSAPELLAGIQGEFEADRERLRELLIRLGTGPKEGPGPIHPLFGRLSRLEWGCVVYKHTDYHLRQFSA